MRNITVKVDDQTYRDIRAWCAQRDTCVSHVVQAFLRDLPNRQDDPCLPLPYTSDHPAPGEGFPSHCEAFPPAGRASRHCNALNSL